MENTEAITGGTRVAFIATFLGRQLAYTYEVIVISNDTFVMKTAEGPFPMETTYTFESKSAAVTIMTLRNKGIPSGFSRFFSPLMRFMMKRANNKDLRMIKSILEKH